MIQKNLSNFFFFLSLVIEYRRKTEETTQLRVKGGEQQKCRATSYAKPQG